jgi:hypothetical protein
MNFKKQAYQLEKFLEDELIKKPPITVLSNGSLVYNNFIIDKTSIESWSLKRRGGNLLDTFNLKASAIAAANLYSRNNFKNYSSLKILDEMYFKHSTDANRYKNRYQTTNDLDLRDLFISRYMESKERADYAKQQIVTQFRTMF